MEKNSDKLDNIDFNEAFEITGTHIYFVWLNIFQVLKK